MTSLYQKQLQEAVEEIERTGQYDKTKMSRLLGTRFRNFEGIWEHVGKENALDFIRRVEPVLMLKDKDGMPRLVFQSKLTEEEHERILRNQRGRESGRPPSEEGREDGGGTE